jgi:hypothetical protein
MIWIKLHQFIAFILLRIYVPTLFIIQNILWKKFRL